MSNRHIDLSHYEFVRVSGVDAVTFLQGQLTADLDQLTQGNCLTSALCNLKGRVIADFRIALRESDCILQTTSGMAEIIITTLSKYAVFSKVEIARDDCIHAFGILTEDESLDSPAEDFEETPQEVNQYSQSDKGILLKIEGARRYELWSFEADSGATSTAAEKSSGAENNMADWHRADILSGVFHVDSARSEMYTPQLLNFDISGVLNFEKGCYTGQEVVARMFYRGKAKKRLYLLSIAKENITAPTKLEILRDDKSMELDVLSAENASEPTGGTLILAIAKTSIAESDAGSVTSGDIGEWDGVPVTLLPLPYLTTEA